MVSPKIDIASGRQLPRLIFVTSADALRRNIGKNNADIALSAIRGASLDLLEDLSCDMTTNEAVEVVNTSLRPEHEGVVLLGGYDVVPSVKLDVLDTKRRNALTKPVKDSDGFVVWSDDPYGESSTGKAIAVSRIPDARSGAFMHTQLEAASPASMQERFGVRNLARPFAAPIFAALPGKAPLLVSEPTESTSLKVGEADAFYLMLHGGSSDASMFWGESRDGDYVEAFEVSNVPEQLVGVAFAGCCWGALTVTKPAVRVAYGQMPTPRPVETSIALSYLRSGALAFVGCTGSHYSPIQKPYRYSGGPMHEAFWRHYISGVAPAVALFCAKGDYLAGFPRLSTADGQAVELKTLRQFTCLGLGW